MRQIEIIILAVIQHWEIFYLEQSVCLNMLILISTSILDMALGLIEKELFNLVMDLVEM